MAGPANTQNRNDAISTAGNDYKQVKQTADTVKKVADTAKKLNDLKAAGALAKGAAIGPAGIAVAALQTRAGKKIGLAVVGLAIFLFLFVVGSLSIVTNKMFKVNPWQSEAGKIDAHANINTIQVNLDEVSDINTAKAQLLELQEYFNSRYCDEQDRILSDLKDMCDERSTETAVFDYSESLINASGLDSSANISREDALYYAAAVSVAVGQLTRIETNEDGAHVPADYESDHLSAKWMDKNLDLTNTYTWSFGDPVLFKSTTKTDAADGDRAVQEDARHRPQDGQSPQPDPPAPEKQTVISYYYIPLIVSHQAVYRSIADSLGIDLDATLPNSQVTVAEQIDEVMRLNASLVAPDLVTEAPTYVGDMSGVIIEGGQTPVVYFSQRDARWKDTLYGSNTIGRSGCGPTSAAIVISTLTGKTVSPPVLCSWAVRNGYRINGSGTSYAFFGAVGAAYGLKVEGIGKDTQTLVSALEAGKLAIGIFRPGTFASSGHFVVLRGVTESGEVLVADPNKEDNDEVLFPLRTIMGWLRTTAGSGGPLWVVSKQ